jgi:hypothetical protein
LHKAIWDDILAWAYQKAPAEHDSIPVRCESMRHILELYYVPG